MALVKLSTTFNKNGEEVGQYLLQGRAIKDGELRNVGNYEIGKVSVLVGNNKDNTGNFVTVNGWRDKCGKVAGINKGEQVLVFGELSQREYQGKIYKDLNADFIIVQGGANSSSKPEKQNTFEEIIATVGEEEGELPF